MRKIELKEVDYVMEGTTKAQTLNYKNSMVIMLRRPKLAGAGGVDHEEAAVTLPIIKKLREAKDGDFLLLEEAEWKELSERAKSQKWSMAVQEIFDMTESIMNAPKVEVKESEDETEKDRVQEPQG